MIGTGKIRNASFPAASDCRFSHLGSMDSDPKMLRRGAPAEPAEEPLAEVSAPLKRNLKGRTGAVAVAEPEESENPEAFPPRRL